MKTIGLVGARNRLSELIAGGETVTITKRGRPVAILTPVKPNAAEIVERVRANRSIRATVDEIVTLVKEGRR